MNYKCLEPKFRLLNLDFVMDYIFYIVAVFAVGFGAIIWTKKGSLRLIFLFRAYVMLLLVLYARLCLSAILYVYVLAPRLQDGTVKKRFGQKVSIVFVVVRPEKGFLDIPTWVLLKSDEECLSLGLPKFVGCY